MDIIRIVYLVLAGVVIAGWGMNVIKLCSADFEAPYKTEIIRAVGVAVAPMGVIAGFMSIGEEDD